MAGKEECCEKWRQSPNETIRCTCQPPGNPDPDPCWKCILSKDSSRAIAIANPSKCPLKPMLHDTYAAAWIDACALHPIGITLIYYKFILNGHPPQQRV
jgi:hypothetical protein